MQSVKIGTNQAGQRLDKFLHKYLPLAGSGFLYKMLRKKNITLNGKKAEGKEILSVGDEVCTFFSDETFAKFSGRASAAVQPGGGGAEAKGHDGCFANDAIFAKEALFLREERRAGDYKAAYERLRGISLLYEDEDFLILNKPAGILTQKAVPADLSLNEWLVGYLLSENPALAEELPTFRPAVCNRLDRNTSGIVLAGKSLAGLQYLSRCIKEHTLRKYYRTICIGELRQAASIQGYLTKDPLRNLVTVVPEHGTGPDAGSAESVSADLAPPGLVSQNRMYPDTSAQKQSLIHTVYTPIAVTKKYTLLEIELITGKSHQIRAHLASIGHPLAGDVKYGSEAVNRELKRRYGLTYQLLHACRVVFPQAQSGVGSSLSGKSVIAACPDLFIKLESGLFDVGSRHAAAGEAGSMGNLGSR